jgi:hypothetical protein
MPCSLRRCPEAGLFGKRLVTLGILVPDYLQASENGRFPSFIDLPLFILR